MIRNSCDPFGQWAGLRCRRRMRSYRMADPSKRRARRPSRPVCSGERSVCPFADTTKPNGRWHCCVPGRAPGVRSARVRTSRMFPTPCRSSSCNSELSLGWRRRSPWVRKSILAFGRGSYGDDRAKTDVPRLQILEPDRFAPPAPSRLPSPLAMCRVSCALSANPGSTSGVHREIEVASRRALVLERRRLTQTRIFDS